MDGGDENLSYLLLKLFFSQILWGGVVKGFCDPDMLNSLAVKKAYKAVMMCDTV